MSASTTSTTQSLPLYFSHIQGVEKNKKNSCSSPTLEGKTFTHNSRKRSADSDSKSYPQAKHAKPNNFKALPHIKRQSNFSQAYKLINELYVQLDKTKHIFKNDEKHLKGIIEEGKKKLTQTAIDISFRIAAKAGKLELIKELQKCGAHINAVSKKYRQTALIQATMFRQVDIVKYLLSQDADVSLRDGHNKCALDYTADSHEDSIRMQELIRAKLIISSNIQKYNQFRNQSSEADITNPSTFASSVALHPWLPNNIASYSHKSLQLLACNLYWQAAYTYYYLAETHSNDKECSEDSAYYYSKALEYSTKANEQQRLALTTPHKS